MVIEISEVEHSAKMAVATSAWRNEPGLGDQQGAAGETGQGERQGPAPRAGAVGQLAPDRLGQEADQRLHGDHRAHLGRRKTQDLPQVEREIGVEAAVRREQDEPQKTQPERHEGGEAPTRGGPW